ncbi:membrane-associated Zn-dependent protease [Cenarchaeum symbiosum A]|uniref:Membrane-associated Zn-dependent protease n=1 Tax=Cenarchaeum symbiosum (strain A) TaxID=414004 RepID=A0RY87_CENSY|nr:membrane-associated Zn-dependent protease [Cenarchaeum symbiosum A]
MSDPTVEEVVAIVTSKFEVTDMDRQPDMLRFLVADSDFKSKFVLLAQQLEERDLICRLESGPDGLSVVVTRFPPRKQRKWLSKSWTPRILFAVVVAFVMIDGYFRTETANSIIEVGDPLEMAGIYTLSLLGILGIHESGHLVAAKWHKLRTTWPYFIPGIPIYGIPTFGAFIQSRGLTINREILFDIAIAGPIAGLVITILVCLYGAYEAPVIPMDLAEQLHAESRLVEWQQGEPLLMTAMLGLFGKGGEGQEVLMTPVLFAAWIGFLITFLNLLPAWQLDGGHMARTLLGAKWHRYATYASMGVLVLLGYWIMAMFILLLSSRNPGAMPLDDISPLPRGRMMAFAAVVGLAVLCAPLPASILP